MISPNNIANILNEESPDPIHPQDAFGHISNLLSQLHTSFSGELSATNVMHNDDIAQQIAYVISVSRLNPNEIIPKLEQHENIEFQRIAEVIKEILRQGAL